MNKSRVIAYIDGFNLYYGVQNASRQADWNHLKQGGNPAECLGRSLYWLDIHAMILSRVLANEQCQAIKYFSAPRKLPEFVPISPEERTRTIASNERQRVFLEAVRELPLVEVILGWYSEKNPHSCPSCAHKWPSFEEKCTDVNIASHILSDAYENRFDLAIVMSGDADLVPPVELIQKLGKSVRMLLPPGRKRAQNIKNAVADVQEMKIKNLRSMIMPDQLVRKNLPPLTRPTEWAAPAGWVWPTKCPI